MPNAQTKKGQELYNTAAAIFRSGEQIIMRNSQDQYGILGCAETVNLIAQRAWGAPIGGGLSTAGVWSFLRNPAKFTKILPADALPGDIIISPTGSVPGARLAHGHVGILGQYGILSNNSETGHVAENFDIKSWVAYYTNFGGLPTLFYRAV